MARAGAHYGGELVEWSECEEYFTSMPEEPVDESLLLEAKDANLPSIWIYAVVMKKD